MDRTSTIATTSKKRFAGPNTAPNPFGLEKYEGPWTYSQAAHLLRRTVYGPNRQMILETESMGMDEAVRTLLEITPLPNPPINHDFEEDPEVPIGETWVDANYYRIDGLPGYRQRSLVAWMIGLSLEGRMNIREKLTLFWHNHFVVADIADARYLYRYINLLRTHSLGDFRQMVKDITIDPAMLRYLNGNENTLEAPNENYARELLELFTVGKGDLAGPGDYSTFTEDDVIEIAKVLTGWRDYGFNNPQAEGIGVVFRPGRHEPSTKQLSHRFNNATINNGNASEYETLIDIIMESEDVALFICRKLYRWFVYYNITDEIEANVIVPMAQIFRDANYNIKAPLEALLSSAHFYDEELRGCMIKNPLDFILSCINQLDMPFGDGPNFRYRVNLNIFQLTGLLQMQVFNHPDVAGWKAYYQSPSFYQIWINSVTLPLRTQVTDSLIAQGNDNEMRLALDPLNYILTLSDPLDINAIIQDISDVIYSKNLTPEQVASIKNVILPGLPDFEWNLEYSAYLEDPDDEDKKKVVEDKLKLMFLVMLRMPEYQLS